MAHMKPNGTDTVDAIQFYRSLLNPGGSPVATTRIDPKDDKRTKTKTTTSTEATNQTKATLNPPYSQHLINTKDKFSATLRLPSNQSPETNLHPPCRRRPGRTQRRAPPGAPKEHGAADPGGAAGCLGSSVKRREIRCPSQACWHLYQRVDVCACVLI